MARFLLHLVAIALTAGYCRCDESILTVTGALRPIDLVAAGGSPYPSETILTRFFDAQFQRMPGTLPGSGEDIWNNSSDYLAGAFGSQGGAPIHINPAGDDLSNYVLPRFFGFWTVNVGSTDAKLTVEYANYDGALGRVERQLPKLLEWSVGPLRFSKPTYTFIGFSSPDPISSVLVRLDPTVRIGLFRFAGSPQPPNQLPDCPALPGLVDQAPTLPQSITLPNGWRSRVEFSARSGLVLKDVYLNGRYVCKRISCPYLRVATSASPEQEVRIGLQAPGCHLLACEPPIEDSQGRFHISATWAVEGIGKSRLRVTQKFIFDPYDPIAAVGPGGLLQGQRLIPNVSYGFQAWCNEKLESVKIIQRVHSLVDGLRSPSVMVAQDIPTLVNGHLDYVLKVLDGSSGNPLRREAYVKDVIKEGGSGGYDSFHQTWSSKVEKPFRLFNLVGCPECTHMHWKWAAAGAVFGHNYMGIDGNVIIPSGSKQSVDIAVVSNVTGEDEDDGMLKVENHDYGALSDDPVLYYIGRSTAPSDSFCEHGAFFKTDLEGSSAAGDFPHWQWDVTPLFRILPGVFDNDHNVMLLNTSSSTIKGPIFIRKSALWEPEATKISNLGPGEVFTVYDQFPAEELQVLVGRSSVESLLSQQEPYCGIRR